MASAQAPGVPILDYSFAYGGVASSSGPGPYGTFQYCAVKADGNDLEVAPSSSAGVTITPNSGSIGVLQTMGPTAVGGTVGMACTVRMLGLSKMVVDGSGTTITPGAWLTNDAAGRGVVDAASSSVSVIAMALQKSTAQNDIISVFVLPSQVY